MLAVLYSARVIFQPALPMRGVTCKHGMKPGLSLFQPALPMRGVTRMEQRLAFDGEISTRTPHAGSDNSWRSAPRNA